MYTHTYTPCRVIKREWEECSSAEQCWDKPNIKTGMSIKFRNMKVNGDFTDKSLDSVMCYDLSEKNVKEKFWYWTSEERNGTVAG